MTQMKEERLLQVLLAPVISEKSTMVADKNEQVVFRVVGDATKPEIKAAVELLQGAGRVRADHQRQAQAKALRPYHRCAQGLEEGLRCPQAGSRN